MVDDAHSGLEALEKHIDTRFADARESLILFRNDLVLWQKHVDKVLVELLESKAALAGKADARTANAAVLISVISLLIALVGMIAGFIARGP